MLKGFNKAGFPVIVLNGNTYVVVPKDVWAGTVSLLKCRK